MDGALLPPATTLLHGPTTPLLSKSLAEQVDDAMAQLLSVSAKFKDLNGNDVHVSTREETVAMMQHYLTRLNLSDAVSTQLAVIHVAGTKGKGSTCAMTERILREAGYKTGMFTSPHLITPCERFRINGRPISDATFLTHFYSVWDGLTRTSTNDSVYPKMAWFFRFLTLLALRLFIVEQVDVVILEVGIGGRLDATNVIERPIACGITTLDLDHVSVLGNTLEKIAYAKGGILKRGVYGFTAPQPPQAMEMLQQCALETQALSLVQAPTLDEMGDEGKAIKLGMQGIYQRVNAGLAVCLAATFMQYRQGGYANPIDLTSMLKNEAIIRGLSKAFWPARSHVVHGQLGTYYIDGAHTRCSIQVCADWYHAATPSTISTNRVLIFTIHHERNVATIITPLLQLIPSFARVYFCKTKASRPSLAKVHTFSEALKEAGLDDILHDYRHDELEALDAVTNGSLHWQDTLSKVWRAMERFYRVEPPAIVQILPSVIDCIDDLRKVSTNEPWQVLVTGSLYLAGETLHHLGWNEER